MQSHVLLGQLTPHGVRGKDGRQLSDLEGLDCVGEGGGDGPVVRVFQFLSSISTFNLNVADLNISGGRFTNSW